MRKFEKISKKQFDKDVEFGNYDSIILPNRKTIDSAGYDFIAFEDILIKKNEVVKIPTGVKLRLNSGEFLLMCVRSSMGFKYNVRLCNQIGIIDKDYYNNTDNEGHIWVCLQNQGNLDYLIKKGDSFAQGIILQYNTCDNDDVKNPRIGGLGSTNKEED